MAVVGNEGLSMPEVTEKLKREMQKLASQIISYRV
jgi:hypothetical protein